MTDEVEPTETPTPEQVTARQSAMAAGYLKQIRNATTFIAWIVGILAVLALIGVIVTGVQLNKLNSPGGGSGTSCYSEGGTDLSC